MPVLETSLAEECLDELEALARSNAWHDQGRMTSGATAFVRFLSSELGIKNPCGNKLPADMPRVSTEQFSKFLSTARREFERKW